MGKCSHLYGKTWLWCGRSVQPILLPSTCKHCKSHTRKIDTEKCKNLLLPRLYAEAEHIKWKMKAIMRANGQAESITDDNRSSTGNYKGKSTKGGKQTTYCSACSEPFHNSSKWKMKYTLFDPPLEKNMPVYIHASYYLFSESCRSYFKYIWTSNKHSWKPAWR